MAAAAAIPLAGCSVALPRATARVKPVVKVSSFSLWVMRDALMKAWTSEDRPCTLVFVSGPARGTPAGVTGDLLNVEDVRGPGTMSAQLLPLSPFLKAANFDATLLPPASLAPFTNANGDLLGLPLAAGEDQFFANTDLLQQHKLPAPDIWTWDLMLAAASALQPRRGPLVAGQGWGQANWWGALVLGLGGTLLGNSGQIDLDGAVAPTLQILAAARQMGWNPKPAQNPDFYGHGFARSASDLLFYFAPPTRNAISPSPFPMLPRRTLVPGESPVGLGVSALSEQPELAGRVLLWFFEPGQQLLLSSLQGWPPVVQSATLDAEWQRVESTSPTVPRFDGKAYFNLASYLPPLLVTTFPYESGGAVHPTTLETSVTNQYEICISWAAAQIWAGSSVTDTLHQLQDVLQLGAETYNATFPPKH